MRIKEMDDRWVHGETNVADYLQWKLFTTNDEGSIVHSSHVGSPALGFLQRNHMIFDVRGRIEKLMESGIGRDCFRVIGIE